MLKSNWYYNISISKDGYEAKLFTFSTMDVDPKLKYVFLADIILQPKEAADYDSRYPVVNVSYDQDAEYFITTNLSNPPDLK